MSSSNTWTANEPRQRTGAKGSELTVNLPLYAPYRLIARHCAAVPRRVLLAWVQRGWVRSVKTSDRRQAGRLFQVRDVMDALDRMAGGYVPRTRRRMATPASPAQSSEWKAGSEAQGGAGV